MKICRICDNNKPFCDFNIRKDSKDGYRNECKECKEQYDKNRFQKNQNEKPFRVLPHPRERLKIEI